MSSTMGMSFESLSQLPRPFGPFTLIRLIAQGGMGQVFLALRPVESESVDEICVVKTVRTDLKDDREAVGRFLDEARVVQKLDHQAICHTLDAGVVDKTYYLALEFISGRNLRDIQTRAQKLGRAMPPAVIFHAATEMLAALDYAHALVDPDTGDPLRIVHRDVSPHNVMLGFDGYVKLIDFGLAAHELKTELTRPGIMVGKLRYNAPEQVRDRALDGRSDVYSVGVMLYELLSGERFYEGLSEDDIWRVAMKGSFRPRLLDKLEDDLREILELALAPTPEERFASAGEMREAVLLAARARSVREMRRQSARFMGEIFVDERQSERDMILQATGLAEARTRLFDMPKDSLHEGHGGTGQGPQDYSSFSVGRTKVMSPAAVRGRLADLVSKFDPDAETVLPEQPIFEEGEDGGLHDDGAEGSDPFASSPQSVAASAAAFEAVLTVPASPRRRSGDQKPEAPIQGPTAPIPLATQEQEVPAEPTMAVPRSAQRRSTSLEDESAPAIERRGPGVLLVVAGAVLLLVVIAALGFAIVPRLLDHPPPVATADTADAGVARATQPVQRDASEPTLEARPPQDEREPPPADAGSTKLSSDRTSEVRPSDVRPSEERSVDERPRPPRKPDRKPEPKPADTKRPPIPPTPPIPPIPPIKEFRTLKDQVDYLKEHCVARVACARPAIASANNLVALSPEETKQLMSDVPKCIERCQR